MEKKWLTAIWLSKENIFKIWDCKVSYDVTDVAVPENTVFYFFSKRRANLEIIQLSFSIIDNQVWFDEEIDQLVMDHKLYCCGKKYEDALIIEGENKNCIIPDFFDTFHNFKFEFI